jgi:hypothetical protein
MWRETLEQHCFRAALLIPSGGRDACIIKELHCEVSAVSSVAATLERDSPLKYFTCNITRRRLSKGNPGRSGSRGPEFGDGHQVKRLQRGLCRFCVARRMMAW